MSETRSDAHAGHGHAANRFAVLSTPERLADDGSLAGRGVTIALLDSGFSPHPDLTAPRNRIVAYHDVFDPEAMLDPDRDPEPDAWHGTQTSVVAAGSGHLSDGLYRGLASEARLVLVRVGRNGRIAEDAIAKGLEWVLAKRERFGIRVASLSLGGDEDRPLAESRVNQLAEEAVALGIVVVAAAGNSGCTERHRSLPPATAPSVIAVGGYDDGNDPERRRLALYCSSFGRTADGLVKPEIIAPAMWVAAPILPRTPAWRRAEALASLAATPDHRLVAAVREAGEDLGSLGGRDLETPDAIRGAIDAALREAKIVAAHYQHVDGTSFAAPIVASVVAQMLEANPDLSPADVKRILLQTAVSVAELPAIRQGYGVLDPAAALAAARREVHGLAVEAIGPRVEGDRVSFAYHDDAAASVGIAGDFNDWRPEPLELVGDGVWRTSRPAPPPGTHRYKLLVDARRWIADPGNGMREPDPYGGSNSILAVKPDTSTGIG
jgi:serine protease AprX